MKKYTNEQIQKAMKNAKATIEVEGSALTQEQEALVFQKLSGEITEIEFLERAIQFAKTID